MKLINNTNFRTDQLNQIIREVAKRELVDLKDASFTINYRRIGYHGAYIGGWAYFGMPPRVTLKIPKSVAVDVVELAYVIAHELGHSQGLRHKQMKNSVYSRRYCQKHGLDWRHHYSWASDFRVEAETVEVLPKPTREAIIQHKRDKCKKAMDKWESKVKRTQNCYLKWRRKFMYYESQLVKAASGSPNKS